MTPRRRTFRLDVQCPRCGTRPDLHTFPTTIRLLKEAGTQPGECVGTHRCERCRKVYVIEARAYLEAS